MAYDDVFRPMFEDVRYRELHNTPLFEPDEKRATVELLVALQEGTVVASGLLSTKAQSVANSHGDWTHDAYYDFSTMREKIAAEEWGLLEVDWTSSTLTGHGRQYANIVVSFPELVSLWGEPESSTIPASDRTVSIDHNKPETAQALQNLDRLIDEVRSSNEVVGAPDDKQRVIAELSAVRKLLDATKVRAQQLSDLARPALAWVMENFGKESIKELAKAFGAWLVKGIFG